MPSFVIQPSDEAVQTLAASDAQMQKLITVIGKVVVPMRPDYFRSLARSITGQQISVKAAETIFSRLEKRVEGHMTPEMICQVSDDQLRATGLSGQKTRYLRDLAAKIQDGTIDFTHLHALTNQAVIKQLTAIKGIGKWTAEMFLIFSLGRMNVLATDDVGLQRGAKWLYDTDESTRKQILLDKQKVWTPHLTIASFYLWKIVDLGYDKAYLSIEDIT
ncbi:DNA-3-methyladenine glycosylase [Barrientosiimonas marina]|uniref:DNA-3-methyladenine glycosylase II n=1 Tax=Lentibacillus kimchii TaxID=1542911 RepID=A0ABW2UNX9_9BACI